MASLRFEVVTSAMTSSAEVQLSYVQSSALKKCVGKLLEGAGSEATELSALEPRRLKEALN